MSKEFCDWNSCVRRKYKFIASVFVIVRDNIQWLIESKKEKETQSWIEVF